LIFPAAFRSLLFSNVSRIALRTVPTGIPSSLHFSIRCQSFGERRNGVPRSAMKSSSTAVA